MMNILYVVHQFFPHHYTGTERLTLQLAKQIKRMGHLVTILTSEPLQDVDEGYVQLEPQINKKIYFIDSIPVISFQNYEAGVHFDIFPPKIEKYLEDIIKDYDLVHFTHPMRNGAVLKLCKTLNIPTVLTLTDNWLLCPQGLITINQELCDGPEEGHKCVNVCNLGLDWNKRYGDAKYFFENVDAVFTGTKFVQETFRLNNWKREIELNTFSMDYSVVEQHEDPSILTFAFIGTFSWHKGLHVLINSFRNVKNKKIKLKIYGAGDPQNPYVKDLYKKSKDDSRIEFCGIFNYDNIATVMKDISVVIIPSVYKEIYPLVMQASFAFKKPVIASRIGGMPESIINEENGFLFETGNEDELTTIISKIAETPSLLQKLKKNIILPPRVEQEAFIYSLAYEKLHNSVV